MRTRSAPARALPPAVFAEELRDVRVPGFRCVAHSELQCVANLVAELRDLVELDPLTGVGEVRADRRAVIEALVLLMVVHGAPCAVATRGSPSSRSL